ncbi:MAG: hypothetical protein GC168_18045 [Candidatus Hydrogenedens sp.]|nr:hypothetical protein [Candidatus Hydrogenedens sp.]
MADKDKDFNDDDRPLRDLTSDSGLGNLPPLSDFDSQTSGGDRDSGGLPPLGDLGHTPSDGAISDIDVETPGHAADLFSSGSAAGTPNTSSPGTGFQDLAADSDFSPETPEIGPGPDSNLDTPMFDSAFGGLGAGDSNLRAGIDTPAPTQAMETPMFGGTGSPTAGGGFDAGGPSAGGFDLGDFGGGGGNLGGGGGASGGFDFGGGGGGMNFDAGTPAPDFSPDTGMGGGMAPNTKGDGGKKGGGGSPVVMGLVGIAALAIGMVAGPIAIGSYLPPALNPALGQVADAQTQLQAAKQESGSLRTKLTAAEEELRKIREAGGGEGTTTGDPVAELQAARAELEVVSRDLETKSADLSAIEQDILDKNEEFLQAQTMYEDLRNETAIIQARQKGLVAEVERLTNYVGQLEDANARRIESRDALATAVDRLYITVKEGSPLTPEKYDYQSRVAAVERLRDQIDQSNWISPALQEGYTELYLKELEIAQSSEYFFAKLSLTDEFGNKTGKWCECVMQGNWGVLYRSLDGKNIGEFRQIEAPGGGLRWGYKEDMPRDAREAVEGMIFASRVEGFEDKIALLAAKQLAAQDGTEWQRAFSSL